MFYRQPANYDKISLGDLVPHFYTNLMRIENFVKIPQSVLSATSSNHIMTKSTATIYHTVTFKLDTVKFLY